MSERPGHAEQADPRQALRILIERGEGTSASATMLRLLWLRQDHPLAAVSTEAVHLTDSAVVIRATIGVEGGASGSGLAAATVDDPSAWAEAVERAETTAISRALDTLGYVLERASVTPTAASSQPQPPAQLPTQAPAAAPAPPAQGTFTRQASQQGSQPAPQPTGPRSMPSTPQRPTPITRQDDDAPPVVNALRRAQARPQAVPNTPQGQAGDDDAHLPEYSWTNFWNAARSFGLDAKKVEEILGRPAKQSSPKEAVEALRAAGVWGSGEGDA